MTTEPIEGQNPGDSADNQPIGYERSVLSRLPRGQLWCGWISVLLAISGMLVNGAVLLFETKTAWQTRQEITEDVARATKISLLQKASLDRIAAAKAWCAQQASRSGQPLSDQQVGEVLEAIRPSRVPTVAQLAAIAEELKRPGQQLIDPDVPINPSYKKRQATRYQSITNQRLRNGGDKITVAHYEPFGLAIVTTCEFDTMGQVQTRAVNEIAAATTRASAEVNPFTTGPYGVVQRLQAGFVREIMSLVALCLNFMLAIFVLIAGAGALNMRSGWVGMHRIYAGSKIIAVVVTAVCFYLEVHSRSATLIAADFRLPATYLLVAMLYPVSLLQRLPRSATE